MIQKDVFLNIAGGLKVNDPAIDLAVISSILSSSLDISIEPGVCMAGEVGLSGEIRPVNRIEQRILEAEKLGFSRIIIPHNNLKGFAYGIATSVTFGLIPLFTLPLMEKGMRFDSILFYRFLFAAIALSG